MKKFNFSKGMTHAGVFHADEVFVTAAIRALYDKEFEVDRVFRVPEDVRSDVFVFDIGGGEYDHHQKGGNGCRENGIPYASAGLFWRDYGPESDFVREEIDRLIVQGIDAIDNGYKFDTDDAVKPMSISGIVSGFNPNWDDDALAFGDDCFYGAVAMVKKILEISITNAESKARAQSLVRVAFNSHRPRPEVLELPMFAPWQDYLFDLEGNEEVLYVVFPSNRGGYNVQQVPKTPGAFEGRKPLPEVWAGLKDAELQGVSGVADATFCHPGRFLCSAETREGALALANLAIEA